MSRVAELECLLFVAGEPLDARALSQALLCDEAEARGLADELEAVLRERESGLQVVRIAGGYQLATRPEHAEVVGRLVARSAGKLSRAALETLSIVAYRQPTTLPEIEMVRGVSSSGVVKTLLERGLITEAGRKQTVGRPILYATTPEFLHYFGLNDLADLPPLDESVADGLALPPLAAEEEAVSEEAAEDEESAD
jgi:segregation and condensation protein B